MKYFWIGCLLLFSCNTQKGLFGKRTAHEKYADRLKESGLHETEMGTKWLNAAQKALTAPVNITIPFRETGYFPADQPMSAGYVFEATRGRTIEISLEVTPNGAAIFIDLYSLLGNEPKHERSSDSAGIIKFEIEETGRYLIRLQPQLLESRGYTLSITTAPSLAYPLPKGTGRIQSYWGAQRDGGARSHEGIDIFAARNTAALAAADGRITRVGENNLGGNVIFMRPEKRNISLYYAHLEKQLVSSGQTVKAGDTIGLIGNTGNARSTPPHLHFGIYASGGAIDPLPFVDPGKRSPPAITANTKMLGDTLRLNRSFQGIENQTPVRVLAAQADNYKIVLPGGEHAVVPREALSATGTTIRINEVKQMLSNPAQPAAFIQQVEPGTYPLVGKYNNFALVKAGNYTGWISL